MDTGKDSLAGKLIDKLEEKADDTHNRLSSLPANPREYLAMAEPERALVAGQIFSNYANMPTYESIKDPNNGLAAFMPTGRKGVIMEARVGYTKLEWLTRSPQPQLKMWLRATEPKSDLKTGFKELGGIVLPREDHEWQFEKHRPDHELSLEIMDVAVGQLLKGMIAAERAALGNSALLSALSSPVH